jgi:hypothetical protein
VVCDVKDERDMSTDELSRVMISRKVGLMVGSPCQHVFISSANSAVSSLRSCAGVLGRTPSRITATATAAGLHKTRHFLFPFHFSRTGGGGQAGR